MLPTIFETAPINYISPRISNDDNLLVPSPSFKDLSSSRNKKIDNNNNKMCGGEITVEDDKVYIPTRRVFDDNDDDDDDESSSISMTNINTVLQINLDDIPDLPFDCPADMISSSEQEELGDDDADDDVGVSVKNEINFVSPRPLLRSSTTPTDTSLSLLQRQQQHNDEVRKQARASLLYSSSSNSPRSVTCISNLSGSRPAAA